MDIALYIYTFIHLYIYTFIHLYNCINVYIDTFHLYIYTFIQLGGKRNRYMLPVQSHGERGLVDGSLQRVFKHLGVDAGAGGV